MMMIDGLFDFEIGWKICKIDPTTEHCETTPCEASNWIYDCFPCFSHVTLYLFYLYPSIILQTFSQLLLHRNSYLINQLIDVRLPYLQMQN